MSYRFNHLHLLCRDLESMIGFFTNALGARLVERKQFGGASGAEIDLNGMTINVRVAKKDEVVTGDASQNSYGYHHLGLEVEDLQQCMQDLSPHQVEFLSDPIELDDMTIVFFKGPEKITIELMQMK